MGLPLDHPQRAAGDFQQALRCFMPHAQKLVVFSHDFDLTFKIPHEYLLILRSSRLIRKNPQPRQAIGAGRLKLSKVSVLNDQSVQLTMRMHPASAVNRQNLPIFQKMHTAISLSVA